MAEDAAVAACRRAAHSLGSGNDSWASYSRLLRLLVIMSEAAVCDLVLFGRRRQTIKRGPA